MPDLKQMKPSWVLDTRAGGALELVHNPQRPLLAMPTADGPIVIINTENTTHHVLSGHAVGCSSVCWSPDGNVLVSIGHDGRLRWWDASTLKQILDNPSGGSWGVKVVFSADGKYLCSAAGKKLTVWDAQGQMICQYPDHASTVAGMAWRPGLEQVVSCCYGVINFWHLNGLAAKRTFPWKGSMLTLSISPDGKYISTGDQDASVHFWDVKSGKDLMMSGYQTKVRELSWSADSRYLATGGAPDAVVWDCSGRGPAGTTPIMLGGPKEAVSVLAFSPSSHILAVGSKDGLLFIWDVLNPANPLAFALLKTEITGLAWAQDKSLLVTADSAGGVQGFRTGKNNK